MFAALHRRKTDSLHRAMQFGAPTSNVELRREVFKAAAGFLARERVSIMQYLSLDGVPPNRIDTDLEEEFRAEIVEAINALDSSPAWR